MEMLQKYRLLEKLGDGAQGTVYRAQDQASLQPVAIRTLGAGVHTDLSTRQGFEDECRAIAGLKHANIACIRDYGDDGEIPFVATEWLTGRDLRAVIASKPPFLVEQKLSILMQIGEALEHAANSGVVHRNLRPSKIHLTPDGKVKIRDFGGVSMRASQETPPDILRDWQQYMAPEQIQGAGPSAESNIFSLGLIAYEFCTGTHPFADQAAGGDADPLTSPSSFPTVEQFPELPLGLWPIVEKCLARDPAERFPTMADFRLACHGLLCELAEDSQLLLAELQTALPRLRTAVGVEGAPPEISRLTADVEMALHTGVKSGYQLLNRLAADLAEFYSRLLPTTATQSPFLFEPDAAQPEESTFAASMGMDALPPAPTPLQATEPATRDPVTAGYGPSQTPPVASEAEGAAAGPHPNGDAGNAGDDRLFAAPQTEAGANPLLPLFNGYPDSIAAAQAESSAAICGLSMPADEAGRERAVLLRREIDQARETLRKAVEKFQVEQSGTQPAPAPDQSGAPVGEPGAAAAAAATPLVRQAAAVSAADAVTPKDPHSRRIGEIEVAGKHPDDSAPSPEQTEITSAASHRESKVRAFWVVAPALLLGVALGTTVWLRTQPFQGSAQVSDAGAIAGPLTGSPAGSQRSPSATKNMESGAVGAELRRDVLLEEARNLRSAGLRDESRVFLNRLLELHPGYQPALVELNQVETELTPATSRKDPLPDVQRLLAAASSAIKTGDLPRAKTNLDRADGLQPGLPDVAALRRRWQTKKAEITASEAREQEKQKELARRQKLDTLTQQADDFYRQARYPEALAFAEEQLALDPQFTQALELRIRTVEAQRNLKSYEASLAARQYPDALAAVERLERINPADPNLPAYRKRVETESGGGRAVLSVHALGEAAELMLDDRPAGAKGELANKTIPTGRHRITLRNNAGPQIEQAVDLTDGQKVYLVYDLAAKVMRPMTEADRETMNRRQARQELHRFGVEHVHGIFRGSCKGTLTVNYFDVEYTPVAGNHAFTRPFKNLKLRIADRTAVLLSAADNKEFSSFKFSDAQSAEALKKLWDSLLALDR